MKRLILVGCLVAASGCGSMRLTNEDAGGAMLASDVTMPANGKVIMTLERKPNTSDHAQRYYQTMGVNRGFGGWFGVNAGPAISGAGRAKNQTEAGS